MNVLAAARAWAWAYLFVNKESCLPSVCWLAQGTVWLHEVKSLHRDGEREERKRVELASTRSKRESYGTVCVWVCMPKSGVAEICTNTAEHGNNGIEVLVAGWQINLWLTNGGIVQIFMGILLNSSQLKVQWDGICTIGKAIRPIWPSIVKLVRS